MDKDKAWTIGGLLDWTARYLAQKGAESSRLDTEVLLAHALNCRRIELYTRFDEEAAAKARDRFRDLVQQRLDGCPVAYLVGRKEFYGLEFAVSPAVLIPRPESEFVVMEYLRLASGMHEPRVLDIGTGSGNLAVTIAHEHASAQVTTVDLSSEALAVAARNAARHGVAGRVRFLAGDLFDPLRAGDRFDFVVSNPPYIAHEEIDRLPAGVRDYEPHLALDGGSDGYEVFDRLVEKAGQHLKVGGYLIVEIGAPQEQRARQQIASIPAYHLAPTLHDHSGHARVLQARWQP